MHFSIKKSIEDCQSFTIQCDPEEVPEGEKLEFQDYFAPSLGHIGGDPTTQTTTEEQETKKIMAYNRSNAFLNHLASLEKFQELARPLKSVHFVCVHLDDWEPLLRVLQQQGANIEHIRFRSCTFTERGARLLGSILSGNPLSNDNNDETTISESCFCIQDLDMSKPKGSTVWIDGLVQNKTITCLSLECTSMLVRAIQFLQHATQIKKATLEASGHRPLLESNLSLHLDRDNDDPMETDGSMNLQYLKLSFPPNQKFTLDLCLELGSLLRKAKRLEEFYICNARANIPHDFFRDAIHCHTLFLKSSYVDPYTLEFLIRGNQDNNNEGAGGGGNLKNLHYNFPRDIEKVKQFLSLVDLSLLDTFELNCLALMKYLARYLARNKGPKHLKFFVVKDLKDYWPELLLGFYRNDKIEGLEIVANNYTSDSEYQKLFLQLILMEMPKLRSLKLQIYGWDAHFNPNIQPDSDDEDNFTGPSVEEWNDWLWDLVNLNPNIQEIETSIPVDDDVRTAVLLNKGRKLLRHHDEMSSGIWSHALSRSITGNPETDLFLRYQVIKEIPSLFQQATKDATDEQEVPCFVTDSPAGGQKRRKVTAM